MPTLVLYYPPKKKRWEVRITKERFTIGRAVDADVKIPLPGVSKQHALLEHKGGRFTLRDLESRNGVYLNGFRIREGALTDGDEMQIGGVFITFYRKSPPPGAALPTSEELAASGEQDSDDLDLSSEDQEFPDLDLKGNQETDTLTLTESGAGWEKPLLGSPPPESLLELPGTELDDGEITLFSESEEESPRPDTGESHLPAPHPGTSRTGRPRHTRPPGRGRCDLPVPALVLIMACCVGVGILLGRLGSWLEVRRATPEVSGSPGAGDPAAGVDGSPDFPGPPVSLDDREALGRVVVRLCFDVLGRPPLRGELKDVLANVERNGLREEIWFGVESLRAKEGLPPVRVNEAFQRFLGRPAGPGEAEELLAISRGDPNYFIFHLVTSRTYARPGHRRPRSEQQLARSLYADLLDRVPTEEETRTVIEALRAGTGGLTEVARMMVTSKQAGSRPAQGEFPEEWLRAAYIRALLRWPTEDESTTATRQLAASPTGWQEVLLGLVTRPEYREY